MKYVTYYETEELISDQEYRSAFLKLKASHKQIEKKTEYVERYYFTSAGETGTEGPQYFLCRKDQKEIRLEKLSRQNGLTWKEWEEISLEDARKLKAGDLEWMKEDSRRLVRDFYLQITINHLRYDVCEMYWREEYPYQKGDRMVFYWGCKKKRANYVIDTLPEGFVQMKLRRAKTIPRVIQNMIQGLEGTEETFAYA